MKLSQFNAKIDKLKTARAEQWAALHELRGQKSITVGEREKSEVSIRGKISKINAELFPMEMERAEVDRLVKGKPRKQEAPWIAEEITLG